MSGLAVFGLKCPSLLNYDRQRLDEHVAASLRNLYAIRLSMLTSEFLTAEWRHLIMINYEVDPTSFLKCIIYN
jgi:hypothetical protein